MIGKDNDLGYGIMRVDEDQPWHPFHLGQPLWNFVNVLFFEYGIAAYDLELGATIKKKQTKDPEFQRRLKQVLGKIKKQATKDYVVHPALSIPTGSFLQHPGRQLHRQHGPQRVEPLDHHLRPLPRGRRDLREALDRRRDPRRLVRPPDARLGQHLRLQGDAHHDRQPEPPDRAPPLPGPAVATGTPRSRRRCRRCSRSTT